jgi:NADH-quinone oxidoreductase subunit C
MRDDTKNVANKTAPHREDEALKFYFTPTDPPGDTSDNPHAKASTQVADVIDALREEFGEPTIGEMRVYAGEHEVVVDRFRIIEVCRYLKEELGFDYLSDLGGVDRFVEGDRFEVFYNLISLDDVKRIRVRIRVDEEDLTVPSISSVFRGATWNEREVYDMLGIRFDGHPDLRRMFMPEDFEYYPQRKEFPLLGVPGSLPLPPQTPEGDLTMDPFAAAHGSKPRQSFDEPKSDFEESL